LYSLLHAIATTSLRSSSVNFRATVLTALGAAFAGSLAATNTSGPGLALKSEAIGLAVMAELPIVVIDVMF
jgi:pyruvate/2-oxoacid:ferredoxin oxidoreductase alpha subunit